MTIKTIIFDLDDTLLSDEAAVQQAFDRTTVFLAKTFPQIKAEDFEQALRKRATELFSSYDFYDFTVQIGISPFEGLWGEFNDETLRFPEMAWQIKRYRQKVWETALADIGMPDARLARLLALLFIAVRTESAVPYVDTYAVLDRLYERYQLVLLTNGAPSLQQLKLDKAPKLRKYFKKIIISGDFGQGKPAPELFDFAISRARADKETTVMVGDNLFTDILGANVAGIKSIWLNRHQTPENLAVTPDITVENLTEVADLIENERL
jgi:putative hydrolase of the HAD superfamily